MPITGIFHLSTFFSEKQKISYFVIRKNTYMLVDFLIEDLKKIEVHKKELKTSLYDALQCEDVVKSRMFYTLLLETEKNEITLQKRIEFMSSLN